MTCSCPVGSTVLEAGDELVVIGPSADIDAIRRTSTGYPADAVRARKDPASDR